MKVISLSTVILSAILIGCGIGDSIDKASKRISDELDESIEKLESESMDWRTVLQELEGELNDDISRQIRGEVSNLLNSTIAVTGTEFRCNADFLRERVIQSLKSLKGQVKDILGGKPYVQQLSPHICNTVPESVDLDLTPASRREVKYYGFDMVEDNVRAYGITDNGTEIDLSQYLSYGTRYKMSLDISRIAITPSWRQIVIKRNDARLSSIPVLASAPVSCDEKRHVQQMTEYTFIPRHTGGDRDFGGNGPRVNCVVEYLVHPNRIDVKVYMKARETKSDWTTAEQTKTFTVVRADPGRKITRIEGNTRSQRSYTDHNHDSDEFDETGQQPVNRFIFTGDTGGDESGTNTRVKLEFNRLVYFTKDVTCN